MFLRPFKFPSSLSKAVAVVAVLVTVSGRAHAGLQFERTVVEDVVPPGTASYPFEFTFKNDGDSVVEISEIKTSCGCTTAKLEKMSYALGEGGVIQGMFSAGDRRGAYEGLMVIFGEEPAEECSAHAAA